MKENLKTTKDADGNAITRYCYNNDPSNCDVYGGLYSWTTLMNGAASSNNVPSGVRGICPVGWHVPSDAEWTALTDYVSSQSGFLCDGNTIKIAKSLAAQTNWPTSTYPCTVGNNLTLNNATGFSGLPGGRRHTGGGVFDVLGDYGFWWSSTADIFDGEVYSRYLYWDFATIFKDEYLPAGHQYSVRCLRD